MTGNSNKDPAQPLPELHKFSDTRACFAQVFCKGKVNSAVWQPMGIDAKWM